MPDPPAAPDGNVRLQVFVLGTTFSLLGVFTDSICATAAGAIAGRLRTDSCCLQVRRLTVETTYIVLCALALLVHPTKLWTGGAILANMAAAIGTPSVGALGLALVERSD
jgi:hypothetical protein